MKSSFFEQQLVNAGYSILDQVTSSMNRTGNNAVTVTGKERMPSRTESQVQVGSPDPLEVASAGGSSADRQFNLIMCRAQASQSFKEFFKGFLRESLKESLREPLQG